MKWVHIGRLRILPARLSSIDPRPWWGVKRWPSKTFLNDLNRMSTSELKWPTTWIIGLGPVTVTWLPKAIKELK